MADVEHALDRSDSADRVLGEGPSIGKGSDELALHVDRAPAHARDDAGLLQPDAAHAGEDQVLARREFSQEAQDLDIEALNSPAVAHIGYAIALHSGHDLVLGKDVEGLGGNGSREQRRNHTRHQSAANKDPHADQNRLSRPVHSNRTPSRTIPFDASGSVCYVGLQ